MASYSEFPPKYKINLSLPPSERYTELALAHAERLRSLVTLFDELLVSVDPRIPVNWVARAARFLLRSVYTREETEELKGICRAVGIDLFLLVTFNVLLDSFMGCSSGAARSKNNPQDTPRMLHFRTLDWSMDGLRHLVVELEYVRSPDTDHVIARSITYVGFVGVLTGVRKGLSVSLNFRPTHSVDPVLAHFRFYGSHLLVLLGIRRSIASVLRQYLLRPDHREKPSKWIGRLLSRKRKRVVKADCLDDIIESFPKIPTTSAYLIFCDGNSAVLFEKDHRSAVKQQSSAFIVATNSDLEKFFPVNGSSPSVHNVEVSGTNAIKMSELIMDSNDRRTYLHRFWDEKVNAAKGTPKVNFTSRGPARIRTQEPFCTKPTAAQISTKESRPLKPTSILWDSLKPTRSSKPRSVSSPLPFSKHHELVISPVPVEDTQVTATASEIINWTCVYPITNEMTHFACLMDPIDGKFVWATRYPEPLVNASDFQ
ncbi:hypothetical protein FQN57_000640 [Myotisia sp. PD_48]|nr:hypothetical protein FQN57_000640 [Myotisia sp. PD_48]